ncbi:hypothetical protein ES332_D06G212900v1 [Gossypium tomentosum]|uniref:Uncharacterized protein n=1 Tax=Gossypium tomentosum TaxID=34277 RepID=A0A5D2KM78_GOSTO|nr:hypothetical protein ES332_D06G212900v1 [Gossypium tomentosum]
MIPTLKPEIPNFPHFPHFQINFQLSLTPNPFNLRHLKNRPSHPPLSLSGPTTCCVNIRSSSISVTVGLLRPSSSTSIIKKWTGLG